MMLIQLVAIAGMIIKFLLSILGLYIMILAIKSFKIYIRNNS